MKNRANAKLKLVSGERIIKQWQYGWNIKLLTLKKMFSLTLTDRRLIVTDELRNSTTHAEYSSRHIIGAEVSGEDWLKWLICGGCMLCALFAAIFVPWLAARIALPIVLGAAGILIVVLDRRVRLTITLYGLGFATQVVSNGLGPIPLLRSKNVRLIKVKLPKAIADDIAQNLGRLLLRGGQDDNS